MMDTKEEELKKILGLENSSNRVVPICAKLEADMIEMTSEEKIEFLSRRNLLLSLFVIV